MILPSNVRRLDGGDNKTSNYTTVLPRSLELSGNWEVALLEITFPNSWYNVTEEENKIEIRIGVEEPAYYYINPGYYTVNLFLKSFKFSEEHAQLVYNNVGKRFRFDIAAGVTLTINKKLAIKLGFEEDVSLIGGKQGQSIFAINAPDLNASTHYLYVYSNIVKPSLVGDGFSEILRVINTDSATKSAYTNIQFQSPQYHVVKLNTIHAINIKLFDDTAGPVKFTSGKSIVVLGFRRTY